MEVQCSAMLRAVFRRMELCPVSSFIGVSSPRGILCTLQTKFARNLTKSAVICAFRCYMNAPVPKCVPLVRQSISSIVGKKPIFTMEMRSCFSESGQFGQIDERLSSDGARLYKLIVDGSKPEDAMERSLDQLGVRPTTPLVVEVLRAFCFEEKIAFRFFTWAGHEEDYCHECNVYDEMIDIFSSTKYKLRQFRIVCDLLDYMKRKSCGSIAADALFDILRKYTQKHLGGLHKFAKKKKVRLKQQPEIDAFNILLDAFCKCSLIEDAEAMFMKMKSKLKPNCSTYNILFFGWCRVRNPYRAMNLLDEMIKMGYTPEPFTYNTAIETFCKTGMVTEAFELFEFMKEKGSAISSPTAKTYSMMIVAFVRNNETSCAFRLVEEMIGIGCLPDVSTYKDLIEGMYSAGNIDIAYQFLDEMKNRGYPPDIVTYNCFLEVLCDGKNSEEALKLYRNMVAVGCVPSVQTFNMLMRMFFDMGDVGGAFEAWREMDNMGCVRDTDSFCVMIEGLFECNGKEEALVLLEEVVSRGLKLPYPKFDSFLRKLSVLGDLRAIHRLSEHMRKFYNPAMSRRFALSQKRKSMSLRRNS